MGIPTTTTFISRRASVHDFKIGRSPRARFELSLFIASKSPLSNTANRNARSASPITPPIAYDIRQPVNSFTTPAAMAPTTPTAPMSVTAIPLPCREEISATSVTPAPSSPARPTPATNRKMPYVVIASNPPINASGPLVAPTPAFKKFARE